MSQTLRVDSSNNITISDSVVDTNGDAITSGQTVAFNLQRVSDGNWWGGTAFDQASEPGGTLSAAQQDSTGVYRAVLTNAFDDTSLNYVVHHVLSGFRTLDFYTDEVPLDEVGQSIIPSEVGSAVWNSFLVDFDTAGTMGEALKNLRESLIVTSGSAGSGTANTLPLDSNAFDVDGYYVNDFLHVKFPSTGGEQVRQIIAYNGTTKTATVFPAWTDIPVENGGITYSILPHSAVSSDLRRVEGLETVDGITLQNMFINIMSVLFGDADRSGNTYTYKRQDGSTVTVSYTITPTGRS